MVQVSRCLLSHIACLVGTALEPECCLSIQYPPGMLWASRGLQDYKRSLEGRE